MEIRTQPNPHSAQRTLVGVSAGVAAYKAAELVRLLCKAGDEVRVVMTAGAEQFIGATTFQALSGHPVRGALFDAQAEAAMGHIELARWADRVVMAPATADLIARLAGGLANDLLTTLALATEAPVFIAPAMNRVMWEAPATRRNCAQLEADGYRMLGPASGSQACGEVGVGRMLEPSQILAALNHAGAATVDVPLSGALAGRKVLVTAGPTEEPIDPVRYISHESSGRMGYAIAAAAREAGADVMLVSGPTALPPPEGVRIERVRTAAEMAAAVSALLADCDVFIGAAAVADYAPDPATQKHKKSTETLTLTLYPTVDIVAMVAERSPRPYVVGFAAETERLAAHAREKRLRKGMDLIAANEVGPGLAFGQPDNALLLIDDHGETTLPRADKLTLARQLVAQIANRLPAHPLAQTCGEPACAD